jgi:hypothetical protein
VLKMNMDQVTDLENDPKGAARRLARHERERAALYDVLGENGATLAQIVEGQRAVVRASIFAWGVMESSRALLLEVADIIPGARLPRELAERLAYLAERQEAALTRLADTLDLLQEAGEWQP